MGTSTITREIVDGRDGERGMQAGRDDMQVTAENNEYGVSSRWPPRGLNVLVKLFAARVEMYCTVALPSGPNSALAQAAIVMRLGELHKHHEPPFDARSWTSRTARPSLAQKVLESTAALTLHHANHHSKAETTLCCFLISASPPPPLSHCALFHRSLSNLVIVPPVLLYCSFLPLGIAESLWRSAVLPVRGIRSSCQKN